MKKIAKIQILGVTYKVYEDVIEEDTPIIVDNDGVCDFTTNKIFIAPLDTTNKTWQNMDMYKRRVIRHEIIHALFHESGLDHESDYARNEELVDWIAIQFPKMLDVFNELNIER